MPRHVRVEFAGAIAHVTARGNGGQAVFCDDSDRERFLRRLAESASTYGIRLYLFCLMKNHFHLVLETPSANLQRFMQSLETGYTVYFNLKHETHGHLFQGRYTSKLVQGDEYLLKLSRYVHLNPVHVGRIKDLPEKDRVSFLRDYRWSSFRSYVGLEKRLEYVTYGPVLAQTGAPRRRWQAAYQCFVEAGVAEDDADFVQSVKDSGPAIGGEEFCAWVKVASIELSGKAARPEDVSFRLENPHLDADRVMEVVARHLGVPVETLRVRRRDSILRPIAAMMLVRYAGATHRRVAELLGVRSGVAAGKQARKAAALKDSSHDAEKTIAAIERSLVAEQAGRKPSLSP